MNSQQFGKAYYESNRQAGDRPALRFYTRLARSFFEQGRILEFGCGTGFLMKRLSSHFIVDGFEVSAHGAMSTRQLLPDARLFSTLQEIPAASYTGITALHVLEHITDEDLAAVLDAWRAALLPGGRVLCVVPELDGRGHRLKKEYWSGFRDPSHVNLKSRGDWLELLARHGFAAIKTGTDGLWDFPYRKNLPRLIDLLLNSPGTVAQFLAGTLLLKEGRGESLILLLEATASDEARQC
jgi:SAM-dependent methyltransferase